MRRTPSTYAISLLVLAAAVLLRWLLDPVMGDSLPLVTLFGLVDSERQRASAADAVRQIALVRGVRNELQVAPPGERATIEQRDAEIRPQVARRLAMEGGLSRAGLEVAVSNGVVWLEGDVMGRGERLRAITLARTTSGVRRVLAALDVRSE